MPSTRPPVALLALGAACLGLAAAASAQNEVLSLNKKYAYFKAVPGQPPNHYRDDGPIHGVHSVHTSGLGVFDVGNLTDGAVSTAANGGPNTPHLGMWSQCTCTPSTRCCGNAPAADIVFDLGQVQLLTDCVIGTVVAAGSNNNPPDDVTISFSIDNRTYSGARSFDMETLYGPLTDGHHDLKLKLGSFVVARYVKFAFDGGSMQEPNMSDPNEKWMLDEISILGIGSKCSASSQSYGKGLAGRRGVPSLTVSGPPKFMTTINVMGSNSSGAPATSLLIVGIKQTTTRALGGTVLVEPFLAIPTTVPAAGLVFPMRVPGPPCSVPICMQFLQLDSAAPAGVSMTPGLRLDVGT